MRNRYHLMLAIAGALVGVGMLGFELAGPSLGHANNAVSSQAGVARKLLTPSSSENGLKLLTNSRSGGGHYANGDSYDGKPDIVSPIKWPTFGYNDYDENRVFGPSDLTDVVPQDHEGIDALKTLADLETPPDVGGGGGATVFPYMPGGFGFGGGGGGFYGPPPPCCKPPVPPVVTPPTAVVPEPGTWFLLIDGFAFAGIYLRANRRKMRHGHHVG